MCVYVYIYIYIYINMDSLIPTYHNSVNCLGAPRTWAGTTA